jgi:hypothetical protein
MKANRFLHDDNGYTNLVPMVLAIILAFAIIYIGAFVNGELSDSLKDSMGTNEAGDFYTPLENMTDNRIDNISGNWDSSLDIVQVCIIITILAMAVGAIFLFTKFR